MKQYTAGQDVTVSVDVSGIATDTAARVVVRGEDPSAPDLFTDNVTISGGVLDIVVPASANTITGFEQAREVVVTTGPDWIVERYLLVSAGELKIPQLTFVSVLTAERMANRQPSLRAYWESASEFDRTSALRLARDRIARMNLADRENDDRDRAGWNLIDRTGFRINDLTPSEWSSLSQLMREALCTAQVVEACEILRTAQSGDADSDLIESITVGESSTKFRTRMGGLSAKARGVLARYLAPVRVGRG